jgi:hypothetical protein
MKTIPLLFAAVVMLLSGCAGPVGRHNARVDRRWDRRERVATGQVGPYERQADRYDRAAVRYGNGYYNY